MAPIDTNLALRALDSSCSDHVLRRQHRRETLQLPSSKACDVREKVVRVQLEASSRIIHCLPPAYQSSNPHRTLQLRLLSFAVFTIALIAMTNSSAAKAQQVPTVRLT